MPYLVRKFMRAATPRILSTWSADELENISSDITTNEFRTTDERLSTWYIDSLDELDTAALALIMAGNAIESITIVALELESVTDNFTIEATPGNTSVPSLVGNHRDIINLTHKSVDTLLRLYKKAVDEHCYKKYSKGELKNLILQAIAMKQIDFEMIKNNPKLDEAIKRLQQK